MERFDVEFARLYLDAADGFERGRAISRSWRVVFEAPPSALNLQHVSGGMNAHITLDVGAPLGWSIGYARGRSWPFAERLAQAGDTREHPIADRDEKVAALGARILAPPLPIQLLVSLVAPLERAGPASVAQTLRGDPPPAAASAPPATA